jgi:hypothetical protein
VSDRTAQLLLAGLSRAVAEPDGLPLLAGRSQPGLFTATAAGRQAAQRCQDEGLLQAVPAAAARAGTSLYRLTDKGMKHLLDHALPKQLVEDFLRVLEARQAQVAELLQTARQMQASLDSLKGALAILAEAKTAPPPEETWTALCLEGLRRWQGPGDCPLPELYRLVSTAGPLTIGQFHDGLRRLHEAAAIYLHPWTGPLHDLPEPRFALLTGHLVAYYASERTEDHAGLSGP